MIPGYNERDIEAEVKAAARTAPYVIEPCRTKWATDCRDPDWAWHTCTASAADHTTPHVCECGASCPVLGIPLAPSSAEGTPTP